MPTKDGGKPTPRKRGAGAGKGAESGAPPRATRKRTTSSRRQSAPSERTASPPARRGRGTHPAAPASPLEAIARELREQQPLPAEAAEAAEAAETGREGAIDVEEGEPEASVALDQAPDEEAEDSSTLAAEEPLPGDDSPRRRERRGAGTNALGIFIERQFAYPTSPAHSYSDLERHSGISREALSRYVTARADRRRSPTIDTLVAIADALHVSLEAVARAAGASVRGVIPPPEDVQHAREEALGTLVAALSDAQFNAVVELLRQMRPPLG